MEENKKIDEFISTLAELGQFLAKIKFRNLRMEQFETSNKAVDKLIGGFNISTHSVDLSALLGDNEDLQLNKNVGGIDNGEITEKEIQEMLINIPGVSMNKKPRRDGRWQGYVENKGEKIYVYGRTRTELAKKIQYVVQHGIQRRKRLPAVVNGIPLNFHPFAQYYFEKFRKRKVAKKTYDVDMRRYEKYLHPYFKNKPLKRITPAECQTLIDDIHNSGKGKTAEELYSILSVIFKAAIKHGVLSRNPLDMVVKDDYEKSPGKVLHVQTIIYLKRMLKNDEYGPIIMIALYSGLRPNEYEKFERQGKFLIAVNSKRKNGKVEYKKIPVMRGLEPWLNGEIKIPPYEQLRKHFKEILPDHTLKDLRKTFNSRCIECGISETVRKLWMGHSLGELARSYTELSDEYMLSEADKFFYMDEKMQ